MKLSALNQNLIILGLSLLAFLLRAYRLESQSYWIDEAWTIFYAHLSLSELWYNLQTIRAAPPLYHVLTIYWIRLVGDSEYALRFLSLCPSVMAVPLIYRLGKALGGYALGLTVATLLTVSPYQIWHAQDARNYSMLTAASIMSMWAFINLWRLAGWRWWLAYIISTEWAIMTHYHGLVLIGSQGLFLLFTWRRHWRCYLSWAGTLLLILSPLAAWLVFGSTLWQSQHWLPKVDLWASFGRSAVAYSVGELVPSFLAAPMTLAFVTLYLVGLIYTSRRRWGRWSGSEMLAFLLAYTIAPNIAIWVYSQLKTSVYLERYLIAVQAGYLLTIAIGILAAAEALQWPARQERFSLRSGYLAGRRAKIPAALLLAVLIALSGWVIHHHYYDPAYAKPNWRGVIQTIEYYGLPGDAIVMTGDGGEKLFDYYYRGSLPVYHNFNTPAPTPNEARRRIADISARHRRLWYTPYGVDIDATLEQYLGENTYPAWQSWLGRKRLALYDSQLPATTLKTLNFPIEPKEESGLTLIDATLPIEPMAAGDLFPLKSTWQTQTKLRHDYQLSMRLSNEHGDIFAQSDWPPLAAFGGTTAWPPDQPVIDRRSLWIPADTPPGSYALQLVVYEPSSGRPFGQPALISDIQVAPASLTPPLESLSVPNYDPRSLNNLTLVGYAAPEKIQPGQEMWLWLYWQAPYPFGVTNGGPEPELNPILRLSVVGEHEMSMIEQPLTDSVGPLDSWQPGQVRRAIYHLPTSPRLQGRQVIPNVGLANTAGQVEAQINLAPVKLEVRARQFELPSVSQPIDVTFGDPAQLKLIGYDLRAANAAPGESISLTLYWQAEAEMALNYTVYVQLLNSTGQVVAQVDLQPQAGTAPTTTWLPGEILTDSYTLFLSNELPSGHYRLITGLYDAATGQRLPLSAGGDSLELPGITIK